VKWRHPHSVCLGLLSGALITRGVLGGFVLFSAGLVLGLAAAFLIRRARRLTRAAAELLRTRERRANVNAVARRRAGERADSRLALQWARERERRQRTSSGPGELPPGY
jgi:hypothetical protein